MARTSLLLSSLCLVAPVLVGAATRLYLVDSFDAEPTQWSVNTDGSAGVSFGRETTDVASPPGALRIVYQPTGANRWGNLRRAVTPPAEWSAVVLKLRIVSAERGAAMHVWLFESDGDGHVAAIRPDRLGVGEAPRNVWHEVRLPLTTFRFDPRGDGKPDLSKVDRLLIGCNNEALEVIVDDLSLESQPPVALAPLPVSPTWQPADGPRGRLAILDEPGLMRTAGGFDPAQLAPKLAAAGFGVTRVRAGDVADPTRFNRTTFDLLLLNAPAFPLAARDGLLDFLKSGGAFFSVGGYAFDQPAAYTADGWEDLPPETEANHINSRFGQPGDTMALKPEQIGLFDPTVILARVASAELGGRTVVGDFEGLAGVSLAGTNSPVFPDQHGETTPLGQALDRFGRPRGALGVLARFHDGPFKGGAWGGFGVTNRDLFAADAFGLGPLLAACDQLISEPYLALLNTDPPCAEPGEPARASVLALGRGRTAVEASVELLVDGAKLATQKLSLARTDRQTVSAAIEPGGGPLRQVTARLLVEGKEVDRRDTILVVWRPDQETGGPTLAWRNNGFEVNGRARYLTGTNQTGVMWHSPRETPLTWDRDFAAMRDHGLTAWRVLHFSPFATLVDGQRTDQPLMLGAEPPQRLVRQTDAMVYLAQRHGLFFFPTAHDWMGLALSDEDLAAQRRWGRFWADRYRHVPGLMWDIQNEPHLEFKADDPLIAGLYERFLTERHGSLAAAREWLGLPTDAPLLPLATSETWSDLSAVQLEHFRTWLLRRWVRENAAGLKEGNPSTLVTVGYLQTRRPADKIGGMAGLDFANMHSYEPPAELRSSLSFIDRRAEGQGLSLGEFGARNLHDLRVNGGDGEAGDEDRRRFISTVATTMAAGGSMSLNWCFRGLPDVVFPWELFRSDRVARPPLADFTALSLLTGLYEPAPELPTSYVLVPDGNRLGARFNDLDRALATTFSVLHGLHLPFGVLREEALAIPTNAKVIWWPLPYCPSDAAFAEVDRWVRAGGQLYVSGDLGFDERRQYTRGERLARLGLPAGPGLAPFDVPSSPAPTPIVAPVGDGQVTFVRAPVELGGAAALADLYRAFAAAAGADQLLVSPDESTIQVGRVATRAGGALLTLNNYGPDRGISLAGADLHVASQSAGLVLLGGQRAALAVLAQGDARLDGAELVAANGPYLAASLDEHDLRSASAVVVAPLGAEQLSLARMRQWNQPVASVGELRNGRWHELERLTARVEPDRLTLALGQDYLDTLVVIAAPDGLAEATASVSRALGTAR